MNQNESILLVGEDLSFRSSIQLFLGVHSDIIAVGSLAEASKQLSLKAFHVVLLDEGLADGSGIDLLSQIKSNSPFTAVIVLTRDKDFNVASKAMAAGADDYILKSKHSVVDLMVRIPVAQKRLLAKKSSRDLNARLPQSLNDIKKNTYQEYMTWAEKEFFESTLTLCHRDASEAASRLGLSRATVFKKMSDFGMQKRSWARHRDKSLANARFLSLKSIELTKLSEGAES